jgi:hypothetical protein
LAVTAASAESDSATPQAVVDIDAKKNSVNDKLTHFMLIPKANAGNPMMNRNALFDHMCTFRNIQHASAKGEGTDEDKTTLMYPSANLAVHLYPDLLTAYSQLQISKHRGANIKDTLETMPQAIVQGES